MLKRLLLTFTMALAMTLSVAGTASAAPAQTATAPTPCVQSVQNVSGGGGAGPTRAGFEVDFNVACSGHMLVVWQATDSAGHVVWQSENHHLLVSTTTVNVASASWVFGKTPSGTYDISVTLASVNNKALYYQAGWMQVTVP